MLITERSLRALIRNELRLYSNKILEARFKGWSPRGDIGDLIDQNLEAMVRKYGRDTPAMNKITKLPGIDEDDLNRKMSSFHSLIKNIPIYMGQLKPDKYALVQASNTEGEWPGPIKKWQPGQGMFLNNKSNWFSDPTFMQSNNNNKSRQSTIEHEFEHVVTTAIWMLTGVDRDSKSVQGEKIRKVKACDPKLNSLTKGWVCDTPEEATELRNFGDWLVSAGIPGSTEESPFTEEAIESLAFFSLIDHYARKAGKALDRATDDDIEYAYERAWRDWTGSGLGDPDDISGGEYKLPGGGKTGEGTLSRKTSGPLWHVWLSKRDPSIPVHRLQLPGFKIQLKPGTLSKVMSDILDPDSGINTLAKADDLEAKEDDIA